MKNWTTIDWILELIFLFEMFIKLVSFYHNAVVKMFNKLWLLLSSCAMLKLMSYVSYIIIKQILYNCLWKMHILFLVLIPILGIYKEIKSYGAFVLYGDWKHYYILSPITIYWYLSRFEGCWWNFFSFVLTERHERQLLMERSSLLNCCHCLSYTFPGIVIYFIFKSHSCYCDHPLPTWICLWSCSINCGCISRKY